MNESSSDPQLDTYEKEGATSHRTLRMTIAYDGTNYCGWQLQPNGVSLQEIMERALTEFTGEPTKVVAAGRTDAGVHAIGQVISFRTQATTPCQGFLHGLACRLPEDVVVQDVQEAEREFHARYDAQGKWYRYVIHNNPIRVPFLRNAVLWQRSRLDHVAMQSAAQCLIGTHDFRCFETQWPNRSSSVRTVFDAKVSRMESWQVWCAASEEKSPTSPYAAKLSRFDSSLSRVEPPFVCFDISADGFLYNMVRAIVGTLIHVGRGRWTSVDMQRILTAGDRTHAGETAPAQGLYLMRVDY